MIEVKNLTKMYGNTLAVDNISFTVDEGHVYGFLGPNGAGKSTTMNIMTGCLAATEGEVLIDGYDIYENPIEAKSCLGYLPEQPPLYMDQTPLEYLDFIADAKHIPQNLKQDKIDEVIEKTGLADVARRQIKQLSKGYKQRVGIAQAILGDPKVIILDEPTVGLDPLQIIEIRELIKSLGQDHTVILSSHILSEIQDTCDRVIMIAKGRILADKTMEDLMKDSDGKLEDVFIELLNEDKKARAAEALAKQLLEEKENDLNNLVDEETQSCDPDLKDSEPHNSDSQSCDPDLKDSEPHNFDVQDAQPSAPEEDLPKAAKEIDLNELVKEAEDESNL